MLRKKILTALRKIIAEIPLSPELQGSFNSKPLLSNVVSALVVNNENSKCNLALDKIWNLINPDKPRPRSNNPYGREDWTYEDSEEIVKGEQLDWESIVRPSKAVLKDPRVVIKESGHGLKILDRHPKGYFRTIPFDPDVIAKTIYKGEVRDGDDYIFSAWKKGELSPIITIDKLVGDGTHRCMLAYWLGVDVAVVELNI